MLVMCFFFSSRRRHTRYIGDWSSDVCSSDLLGFSEHQLGRRLVLDARGERGARKNRGPRGAALRELRPHAEGTVQEQRGRVQPVELAVQVVAAAEQREAVPEKIVLEPRFVEPRAPWPGDAAHALCCAGEVIGLAA